MTKQLLFAAGLGLALGACQKTSFYNPEPLLSSLTVVNAAAETGSILVDTYVGGPYYGRQLAYDSVSYQASQTYGLPSGTVPLQVVAVRDTTRQVVGGSLHLSGGGMYSLYLAGTAAQPDTLWHWEPFIPQYADSAVAVRVVNLASGSPPVNIVLNGSATPEVTGLGYKASSAFKKYPLTQAAASAGLRFEAQDASGTTLATYSLPPSPAMQSTGPTITTARFKAITLVVSGSATAPAGTATSYAVFAIANY